MPYSDELKHFFNPKGEVDSHLIHSLWHMLHYVWRGLEEQNGEEKKNVVGRCKSERLSSWEAEHMKS